MISGSSKNRDLTEEASKRSDSERTSIGRNLESDEVNERTGLGLVSSAEGDDAAENKVATSIDDE